MTKKQNRDLAAVPKPTEEIEIHELQKGLQEELNSLQTEHTTKYRSINSREDDESGKKKIHPWKILIGILAGILLLAVIIAAVFFIMRQIGKGALLSKELVDVEFTVPPDLKGEVAVESDGIVVYKGDKYCYNENIANILCMGIDKDKLNTDATFASGKSGQADTLFLLSIDTETGKSTMLSISRDAMVDVNIYDTSGAYKNTSSLQLCLAYAFGDGLEMSCENTIRSVSRLLYGVPISSYMAIDLKAIGVLNDAISGVEVEVLEDMTMMDPALRIGDRVKLMGQQAETYVRTRAAEGPEASEESNNARMERQRQYLSGFALKALAEAKRDITVPLTLYNVASDYMVTNLTPPKVTYLASLMVQYGFTESSIRTVPGTAAMGEEYAEFYIDEDALYKMILEIFYEKME